MASDFPRGRVQARPGAAMKALRMERGLTLADLSALTGMTASTLSKVENGKVALTFEKLVRISEGLKVDLTQLVGPPAKEMAQLNGGMRRSISRAGEGRAIEMPRGNYLYVAAELLSKKIIPIIGDVFARTIEEYGGELMRHAGEEYVYVLEGTLELHTEMYTPARLEKGDSVYFDSQMGHAYIAVGDKPCRILSICASSEALPLNNHQITAGPGQGNNTTSAAVAVGETVKRTRRGSPGRPPKGQRRHS
jgi:transcriptional regulator with XRE-family HTH domain